MEGKRKYNDAQIRALKKITPAIAARYLEAYPNAMSVALAMRSGKLPIGEAIENKSGKWTYRIHAERLIAYKHGRMCHTQLDELQEKLNEFIILANKVIAIYGEDQRMQQQ